MLIFSLVVILVDFSVHLSLVHRGAVSIEASSLDFLFKRADILEHSEAGSIDNGEESNPRVLVKTTTGYKELRLDRRARNGCNKFTPEISSKIFIIGKGPSNNLALAEPDRNVGTIGSEAYGLGFRFGVFFDVDVFGRGEDSIGCVKEMDLSFGEADCQPCAIWVECEAGDGQAREFDSLKLLTGLTLGNDNLTCIGNGQEFMIRGKIKIDRIVGRSDSNSSRVEGPTGSPDKEHSNKYPHFHHL